MFNKNIIAQNFSKAAKNYDDIAEIQKIVAKNLCNLSRKFIKKNSKILDLGSGTSFIAKEILSDDVEIFEVDLAFEMLNQNLKNVKNIFKIQADIEELPFKNEQFDVIISSFSLQWLNNFSKTFNNFNKLLKKDGILAFSIPLEKSLQEINKNEIFNFNKLPNKNNIKEIANSSGFKDLEYLEETLKQDFLNKILAIKSIKKLGANYSSAKNILNNITNKNKFGQFKKFYLKNSGKEKKNISISWNVGYFIFKK